jgi:hypothetical protein
VVTTKKRILLIAGLCLALIVVGWGTIFAALYASGGMVTVRIQDRSEDLNLYIPMPAVVAMLAADASGAFIPQHELREFTDLAGDWKDSLSAVLDEIEDLPDVVLVEVEDGSEHVTVRKKGRSLEVVIHDRDLDVRVTFPVKLAQHTVKSLLT